MIHCLDFETCPIGPGEQIPEAVVLAHMTDVPRLISAGDCTEVVMSALRDAAIITGANIGFDVLVSLRAAGKHARELWGRWLTAYLDDRIYDVLLAQKYLDNARGCLEVEEWSPGMFAQNRYDLGSVGKRYGFTIDKTNPWRKRYAELRGIPIAEWPEDARTYPLDDVRYLPAIRGAQLRPHPEIVTAYGERIAATVLQSLGRRCLTDLAMRCISVPGVRCDAHAVQVLSDDLVRRQREAAQSLMVRPTQLVRAEVEWITDHGHDAPRVRERLTALGETPYAVTKGALKRSSCAQLRAIGNGGFDPHYQRVVYKINTRNVQRLVVACTTVDDTAVKLTTGKHKDPLASVAIDADVCETSDHPDLEVYADYIGVSKTLNTYVPYLVDAVDRPVHTCYDALKSTGRSSSSAPNLQNPPRYPGVRECFIPRDGWVFVSADFGKVELHAFAQVALWTVGYSRMADALRRGADPHLMISELILSRPYVEIDPIKDTDADVSNARTAGKCTNFGRLGMLGPDSLVRQFWSGYGIRVTRARAVELIGFFDAAWPEHKAYLAHWKSQRVPAVIGGRRLTRERADGTVVPETWVNLVHPGTGFLRGRCSATQAANSPFQHLASEALGYACVDLMVRQATADDVLSQSVSVLQAHDEIVIQCPLDCAQAVARALRDVMLRAGKRAIPEVPPDTSITIADHYSKRAKSSLLANGDYTVWRLHEAVAAAAAKAPAEVELRNHLLAKGWPAFAVLRHLGAT